MADLYYMPSDELGPVVVGDRVQVMDRNHEPLSWPLRVTKVLKTCFKTEDGRTWTKERGEWVSEFRGSKPVSWPFPSVKSLDGPNCIVPIPGHE